MAKADEYIEEAYMELEKLSLDEQKRIKYEARQEKRDFIIRMIKKGMDTEVISEPADASAEEIEKVRKDCKGGRNDQSGVS